MTDHSQAMEAGRPDSKLSHHDRQAQSLSQGKSGGQQNLQKTIS